MAEGTGSQEGGNTTYLDYGSDYYFNHWLSTSMILHTFANILPIAESNKMDIEDILQLYYWKRYRCMEQL
jgi:hypothetical protein